MGAEIAAFSKRADSLLAKIDELHKRVAALEAEQPPEPLIYERRQIEQPDSTRSHHTPPQKLITAGRFTFRALTAHVYVESEDSPGRSSKLAAMRESITPSCRRKSGPQSMRSQTPLTALGGRDSRRHSNASRNRSSRPMAGLSSKLSVNLQISPLRSRGRTIGVRVEPELAARSLHDERRLIFIRQGPQK